MNFFKNHSKTNAFIAGAMFVISFIVYMMTLSPSICLWDCGEYLAVSQGLEIPHPPGTPLLVLMGKAWMILFSFISEPGYRYNLFAAFSSALTVMFIYLIIVRGMRMALGEPDTTLKRLVMYCAGIVGSLFCAFGKTFWFESLEGSEQSNITNIPVVVTIWLTLVWAQSKSENRDRLLLLIAYIAFLGIGMHMISMITMPAIFLFVMLVDKEKRTDWRLWASCIVLGLPMYNLSYFLIAAPILAVISLVMMFSGTRSQPKWRFCFWFVLLALIGFSNHLYMPIRSALNPAVDEGHPVTMTALKEVLDRKQYGDESMVSRSMFRRGSLGHQFGIEGHMGYGGFHMLQFFHFNIGDQEKNFVDGSAAGWGKLLVYLLPTFLVLAGWYLMTKKNRNVALFFIAITLLTTLCMVWYMNFADGLHCDNQAEYNRWVQNGQQGNMPVVYREVRVRDYFFVAGYMFFSMWIGISAGLLVYRFATSKNNTLRGLVAPSLLVLFTISPVLPLVQNYGLRDRSGNWSPYDFAYNLLASCAKNGILFTAGDNDTFPLWAIQEAYGYRKDVRIINLSLANTTWYIKQLETVEPKVAVTFSDAQIDALQPELNPLPNTTPIELTTSKIRLAIPGAKEHRIFRVQDKLILNILDANYSKRPIYFACTVGPDDYIGTGQYLKVEGLAYRFDPSIKGQEDQIDGDRIATNLDSVYQFHGKFQPMLTDRDEPYLGISQDYVRIQMYRIMSVGNKLTAQAAEIKRLEQPDTAKTAAPVDASVLASKKTAFEADFNGVLKSLDRYVSMMPWEMQLVQLRQEFLINLSRPAIAEARARELLKNDPANATLQQLLAQSITAQGKKADAVAMQPQG